MTERSVTKDGIASAVITTATPDRMRDVVEPKGGDFAAFLKNPVVMFGHDYGALPVGRCVSMSNDGGQVRATWKWLDGDPFAERVRAAWDQDVLSACSIGFVPKEWEFNEDRKGWDFKSWELLEFSVVPVPANPDATKQLKALRLLDDGVPTLSDEMAGLKADIAALTVSVQSLAKASVPAAPSDDAIVFDLLESDPNTLEISDTEFQSVLRDLIATSLHATVADATTAALNKARGRID